MSRPHRYATEPREFSVGATTLLQLYKAHGSLASLDLQNFHASDDLQVLFCENPWTLSFDGTNDEVSINGAATNFATIDTGSIVVGVRIDDAGSGARTIFAASDASAETALWVKVDTNDKLECSLVVAGTVSWTFTSDNALDMDEWCVIKIRHDGVAPVPYVNGGGIPHTFSVSTDKTDWMDALTAMDSVNLGALDYNSAGNADWFQGDIDFVMVMDDLNADADPALHLLLDEGTGTTATDVSANGTDGTISDAAMWALRFSGALLGADSGRIYLATEDKDVKRGCWVYNAGSNTITGRWKAGHCR